MEQQVNENLNSVTWVAVDSFIKCTKPIIVGLNGHAVGFAVTVLSLCDVIIASEGATLWTPFTGLALCPEGCSSYTFPRMMGLAQSSRFLYLNEKVTAQDAMNMGLVTRVVPSD